MDIRQFLGLTAPVDAVIVTTRTGQSIKGVLVGNGRDGMMLRAASLGSIDGNGSPQWQRLMGDVVIPANNIDFYQCAVGAEILE